MGRAGEAPSAAAAPGRTRAVEPMKERLADALWGCLAEKDLSEVSVGDVIEAADVSRGSFYYHFSDLDDLVAWALGRELLDSDREGHSFVLLAACPASPAQESPLVERSISRACLLLDRGGMSVVYDVALGATLEVWRRALAPRGGELPDAVVAQLEYATGGIVGMLSRAGASSESKRRVSMAFVRERHLLLVRRVAEVLGVSPRELVARLEGQAGPVGP